MEMIKAIGNDPVTPEAVRAGSVFKAPRNYYGKPVTYSVIVSIVRDYPPDSDKGKAGLLSEIVGKTDDGTTVDIFGMVGTGDIQAGDTIHVVAYTVGRDTVDNKSGGTTEQLALVTNKF